MDPTLPLPIGPFALVVSPDGSRLYVGGQGDVSTGRGLALDTTTNQVTGAFLVQGDPAGIAVKP